MKLFADVSSLAASHLTVGQLTGVKGVGDYLIKASGSGITLANSNVAVPVASGTAISVKQFGAVGDGVADDTAAIQAAIDSGAKTISLPKGTYAVTLEISISAKNNIALIGEGSGGEGYETEIKYTGAQDDTKAIIRVLSTSHSFSLSNIYLNANSLSGFCLYQEGDNTPALTRGAYLSHVSMEGYRAKGWVIGDDTDTLNSAQFQEICADNIKLFGGSANSGADGIHLNAQNCEWLTIDGLYIDPPSGNNGHHTNHIRQIAGGLNIRSMLSTRAGTTTLINGYAIYSKDQLIINGWRSEDRYLIDFPANDPSAPSIISGVIQRPDNPAETAATVSVIQHNRIGAPVTFNDVHLNGRLYFGATDFKGGNVFGHVALRSGADIYYAGTRNQYGFHHTMDTGSVELIGSEPGIDLLSNNGTRKFAVTNGNVYTPRINLTQLTAGSTGWDIGDGSWFRVDATTPVNIDGIVSAGAADSGRIVRIVNTGVNAITFVNQSGGAASSSYRFACTTGANIVLAQNEIIQMLYDHTSARWRAWKV